MSNPAYDVPPPDRIRAATYEHPVFWISVSYEGQPAFHIYQGTNKRAMLLATARRADYAERIVDALRALLETERQVMT